MYNITCSVPDLNLHNELHLSHEINVFHAVIEKEDCAGEQIDLLFSRL